MSEWSTSIPLAQEGFRYWVCQTFVVKNFDRIIELIEKTTTLPAARCEQNFILNGIGKLYYFYNIFLSIRAIIPVRTVL